MTHNVPCPADYLDIVEWDNSRALQDGWHFMSIIGKLWLLGTNGDSTYVLARRIYKKAAQGDAYYVRAALMLREYRPGLSDACVGGSKLYGD